MELIPTKIQVLQLLVKQLSNFFIIDETDTKLLKSKLDIVLQKCEINFQASDNKYYKNKDGIAKFDVCHSVQWMTFLYYMSHELYKSEYNNGLSDKIYYLNKIMNSVDLYCAIELPSIFGAEHPIGSIMGRAKYSDGFFFFQNCTVGGTRKGAQLFYPIIGNNVTMYANSSILGNCTIGDNVQIGAGCIVKNQDIPSNSLVFGQSPNLIIKKR